MPDLYEVEGMVTVNDYQYKAALDAQRTVAELDRLRLETAVALHHLTTVFKKRDQPTSELELIERAIHSEAAYLAYFVSEDGGGSQYDSEYVREGIAAVVAMVDYLRDFERAAAFGESRPSLSGRARELVEQEQSAIEEERASGRNSHLGEGELAS